MKKLLRILAVFLALTMIGSVVAAPVAASGLVHDAGPSDGFYLIGPHGWSPEDLGPEDKFSDDVNGNGEHVLKTFLSLGNEMKVVRVENGQIAEWYPSSGGNYVADESHVGRVSIFFKGQYEGGWAQFGGYIWINQDHPHQSELIPGSSPTCLEDGAMDYYRCVDPACPAHEKTFADANLLEELNGVTIPALGHDFVWSVTEEPSCTVPGLREGVCSRCGETSTEEIPPAGHVEGEPQIEDEDPPTCSTPGERCYVILCTVCGEVLDRWWNEIEPLPHTPGEPVIENEDPATCDRDGSHDEVVYCTVCGEELDRVTVNDPALGHDWSEWELTTEPSCTEPGEETRTCSICGETETRPVKALGHDLRYSYLENDRHEVSCSRCDYSEVEDCEYDGNLVCIYCGHEKEARYATVIVVDATDSDPLSVYVWGPGGEPHAWPGIAPLPENVDMDGHNYYLLALDVAHFDKLVLSCGGNQTDDLNLAEDVNEYGWVVYYLTPGGSKGFEANTASDVYPADSAVVVDPTCTEEGYTVYRGLKTGEEIIVVGEPPLGHDFTVLIEDHPATCTEGGYKVFQCVRCDETETREETEALGHDITQVVDYVEPSCLTGGYTTYKCVRCDVTETRDYTDPLGHDFSVLIEDRPATCTEGGYKVFQCVRCDETETREETEALGHDITQVVDYVEPSCLTGGYTTYKCVRCDVTETRDYTDPLGHDFSVLIEDRPATCTEGGYKVYRCERCDETETREEIEALGHDITQVVDYVEPSCLTGGYTVYKCVRCDVTETRDYTDPLGHSFTVLIEDHPATCTEGGYKVYRCERCDETETRDEMEALGHDFGEWSYLTEPTCTEAGEEIRACSRCDAIETRTVEAFGHKPANPVIENETEATETEDGGYDTVVYCEVCGLELSREHTVIPAGSVHADGFYLIGPDWTISAIENADRFLPNDANPGEYLLSTRLETGDSFKVVKVENNAIVGWYPEGTGNDYLVDQAHTGDAVIYFREDWNNAWSSFGGYFYVAHNHSWTVVGDKIVCDGCGEEMELSDGLFELDGCVYYALNGSLQSGWQEIEGDWYYFDVDSKAGMNGSWKNENKVTFQFENGKLLDGVWQFTNNHFRYWYGPDYYKKTEGVPKYLEQEVDGELYLFDTYGYRAEGVTFNKNAEGTMLKWYDCGTDGKAVRLSGPQILENNGKLYYLDENGESTLDLGLILFEGNYYYVIYDGSLKRDGDRIVTEDKTNGLMAAGKYHFDENGCMTNVPVDNGISSDGYYRENGEIIKNKGLIYLDGYYYYVTYNGKIVRDVDRVVTEEMTNGLLIAGKYHFDENGRMTNVPIENGIDEEGYYRVNYEIVKDAGIVMVDGKLYYVIYNGKIKTNGYRVVTEEKANGLVEPGKYYFGADGAMCDPPEEG